jgi:hypothetical protein
MAWGEGGQEKREGIKIELALARAAMYRMAQLVNSLGHAEKRTTLQVYVEAVSTALDRVEGVTNR